MIKAEAWLQCSARGITVTRLAYIGGFPPPADEDGRKKREKRPRHPSSFS